MSGTSAPRHPIFARFWAWMSPRCDRSGAAELRHRLLQGLTGTVVEVGAGNGLNFAHYPQSVHRVVAVEPEPYLRGAAAQAAARAPVPVEVRDGTAERIPLPDASVDAVVASLVLCSVRDQRSALAEAGFAIRHIERLRFPDTRLAMPTSPHILGVAVLRVP